MNAESATDVFISYARENREAAHALAEALAADGHAVWWDRQLAAGGDFTTEIERELARARVVLVLWSAASVQSGFVRDESTRARDAGKLLPLRIEAEVALPLGFGSLHTLELIDWDGEADEPACVEVRTAVRARLAASTGSAGSASPAPAGATPRSLLGALPLARAGWRRVPWRWPAAGAGAVVTAGALWFAFAPGNEQEAQAHLRDGLAAHFAREPNLEVARNAYLAALRLRPEMAVAHYYLALAYGELKLRPAALTHFTAALARADELDDGQRSDATQQRELLGAAEPPPVARSAEPDVLRAAEPAAAARSAEQASVVAAATPPPLISAPGVVLLPGLRAETAQPTLLRVAPTEVQQRQALLQTRALLGSDKPARAAAATTLALDETLAADALPLLLERTLATLARAPSDDASRQAAAATLRLLQSASPAVLRKNRREAQQLVEAGRTLGGTSADAAVVVAARLADAAQSMPVVFMQIADERQRPLARLVGTRLAAMGYDTPGIENVGTARAPAQTQLRVQGASDPALGRWMAQHLSKLTQAEVPVQSLRRAKPATDAYEIWFDKALCIEPARTLPECTPSP